MSDLQIVGVLLLILVLLSTERLISGIRHKKVKLALKDIVNYFIPLIFVGWGCCVSFIGIAFIPEIVETLSSATITSELVNLIRRTTPLVYFLTVIFIVMKIFIYGLKARMKYTDEEKKIQQESAIKFRDKLPEILKFLVKVPKDDVD